MELSTASIYTINNFLLNVRNQIKIKYPSILCLSIEKLWALWFWRRRFFYVLTIVSLWELMSPGVEPFLTPRTKLAGFIKRTTLNCYPQNMKALGLLVSEKIFMFSHCKSMC